MLYYLFLLEKFFSPLRIFRYITVRAVLGAGIAFVVTLLAGPLIINWLRRLKIGQYERKEEAPPLYELHSWKEGTPTMGGVLIMGSILISSLLCCDPFCWQVWLVMGTMLYMGLVGFIDDLMKVRQKGSKGLSSKSKLILQIAWAMIFVSILLCIPESKINVQSLVLPFVKYPIECGIVFAFLFSGLVLVGACNAVNLTDGLDGLAIGCSSSVAISYLAMAYVAGHAHLAGYLNVPFVRGAGELAVFCGCMAGACLGFLWYNCHPAYVFMGDTGSLALGGAIAAIALLIKQEIILVVVGGVFVVEAISVILQIASFKLRGRRIFAMAPLHHHFEMRKWSETQVVVRFWIISIICALIGILAMKIR